MGDTLAMRPMQPGDRAKSEPPPPHPPPTYLWEEVRRNRAMGHYPWTHLFKPPYSEQLWLWEHDHEYEPIQAPVHRTASQPDVSTVHIEKDTHHHIERAVHLPEEVLSRDEEERYEVVKPNPIAQPEEVINLLQTESGYEAIEQPKKQPRRLIRIPNEDAVIIPLHGSSDEELNPDRYKNPALMISDDEIDNTSRTMPTIEVHSPESTSVEQTPETDSFQGKLRSQADKFRCKLKGISKPKISLPQKPKIKLPEKANLKMPEMPKFKLPERPKFNLPERPKFHFPERPKFHLPERPKFHMPEKPKFLTERPKFKFGSEKKPKPAKGKKPNPSSLRRPLRDVVTISSQSTPGSTHNIFETLKFRTYPKFFKKKKKEQFEQKMSSFETESSPSTPPPRMKSLAPRQDTEWVTAYRGLKYADEDEDEDVGPRGERLPMPDFETKEEISPSFHDSYLETVTKVGANMAQAESINSVASEKGSSGSSSVRRRAGVIEEIDSDEFFVRQKGLSREDVDVSRYLSLEIRDAFRQPKNALASLDNELYDEDEPEIKFSEIPRAPQRKKSVQSVRSELEKEFHTFPKRPSRRKESDPEKPPRRFRSRSGGRLRSRQSSMPSLERDLDLVETTPDAPQRRKSSKSLNREQANGNEEDIVPTRVTARNSNSEIPPVAPLRKSRSRGTSLADDDRTSRGADSAILPDDDDVDEHLAYSLERVQKNIEDEIKAEEEAEEEERNYRRAEPVKTIETTLAIPETQAELPGYAVVAKNKKKPPRPPVPPRAHHFHFQSQLDTIRLTGKNIFFTYPRRAIKSLQKHPVRPTRNYSTLGPLRPPRRNRVFRQPVYMKGDAPVQQEEMIEKERDLQSGEIVMRMKGRPLPPPPRPPRRSKDYDILAEIENVESAPTESETIVGAIEIETNYKGDYEGETRSSYIKSKKEDFLNSFSRLKHWRGHREADDLKQEAVQTTPEYLITTSQQTSFDNGAEVSVSIQTDPLPKDVIVIDQEIEETQEMFLLGNKPFNHEVEEGKSEIGKKTLSTDEREETTTHKEESTPEEQEQNIFQHALERVEAARGVLKEARERVIPGGLSSKIEERKTIPEVKESSGRVTSKEALSTSPRSDNLEKEETPPPFPSRPLYTKPLPVSFPDKLYLSELEVERLNVSELQASKIKVSEIETASLDVTDINARSGNLMLSSVELPPEFISNIVAQVVSQSQQQQRASLRRSRESTPQRQARTVLTPPPSIVVQATAGPVLLPEPSIAATQVTTETFAHIPQPRTTRNKGRKSPTTRVVDDSEDELATTMPRRRKDLEKKNEDNSETKQKTTKPEVSQVEISSQKCKDPSVPTLVDASSLQLMRQLFSIWQDNVVCGASSFVQGVNSLFPEGEKRRDAQIAAVILLILITGLILVGFGFDNSVHHHHWDYMPPR